MNKESVLKKEKQKLPSPLTLMFSTSLTDDLNVE